MTSQFKEGLRYRGRNHVLLSEPLDACRDAGVRERKGQLRFMSTALQRRYLGTWEIKRDRLWLVDFAANVLGPSGVVESYEGAQGIEWLFPGMGCPMLVEWFTGELESPRGRNSLKNMLDNEWPDVRVFYVEHGIVTGTELRDNRAKIRAEREAFKARAARGPSGKLRMYLDSL